MLSLGRSDSTLSSVSGVSTAELERVVELREIRRSSKPGQLSKCSTRMSRDSSSAVLERNEELLGARQVRVQGGSKSAGEIEAKKEATVTSTVFNLSNNVVGAGILSMPWCFKQSSILEGVALICFVGTMSGLSLILIAVCCEVTHCFTFRGLGENALGPSFGIVIQSIMFVYTFVSCVSFMILAGDFLSGPNGIPQGLCSGKSCDLIVVEIFYNRFTAVLLVTIVLLLPLSSLRNLNALRYTSLLSMFGMFYLLFLLFHEYFEALDHGQAPPDEEIDFVVPKLGIFQSAPIVNVAFIAHYNVPRFYQEMKDRTISKFATAVAASLSICGGVYILVGLFGYLLFGPATESDVLQNFGKDSFVATIGRVAMGAVVLFTYPLAFNALRASAIALISVKHPDITFSRNKPFLTLTFVLVALTFIPGSVLDDIGVVLDYKGAILGGCIGFGFPAWIFLASFSPSALPSFCVNTKQVSFIESGDTDEVDDDRSDSNDTIHLEEEQDNIEESVHFIEDTASETSAPKSAVNLEHLATLWRKYAMAFIAWAIISGVMGVIVTTIRLVQGEE